MIASVHIADVGTPAALRLLRTKLEPSRLRDLRYAQITSAVPLSGALLPRPKPGRIGLIAAWDDDRAFEGFLTGHPLAAHPARLATTGLARPRPRPRPRALVATFSLWRSVGAMRSYARGEHDAAHRAAVQAHSARPFHHESAFVRVRPYGSTGRWDGCNPLAESEPQALAVGSG